MEHTGISVLMSLYKRESPENLTASLESVLAQTLLPAEIVIVLDGPITPALQTVLDHFKQQTTLIRLCAQPVNRGLGISLAVGVKACRGRLIARMDTDDIMRKDRLELQYARFKRDRALGICGSNIVEFDGDIQHVVGYRRVPEDAEAIRQFSRRRNPFNHMTVMFKKSAVLAAGNYLPKSGFEDYYLWARMLANGVKGFNIQQNLVFARTGAEMYARRGGWHYLIEGLQGRYAVYRAGLGHMTDFLFVSVVHIVVSLLPNRLRGWFYARTIHAK